MRWINIKKRQPCNGQRVLITDGAIVAAAIADTKSFESGIWWDGCGFSGYEWEWVFSREAITHWAELPEPPKSKLNESAK